MDHRNVHPARALHPLQTPSPLSCVWRMVWEQVAAGAGAGAVVGAGVGVRVGRRHVVWDAKKVEAWMETRM